MKKKYIFNAIFYSFLLHLLIRSREVYTIIFSYILIIQPFIKIINQIMDYKFKVSFRKRERQDLKIEEESTNRTLWFDFFLFLTSSAILLIITWYTFSYRLDFHLQ